MIHIHLLQNFEDKFGSERRSILPSIYGATALSGPWPPSEQASILLCLLLVSSILVFLGSVMCPSG